VARNDHRTRVLEYLVEHGSIYDGHGRAHVEMTAAIRFGGPPTALLANLMLMRDGGLLWLGKERPGTCYYIGFEPAPPPPDRTAERKRREADRLAVKEDRRHERIARGDGRAAIKEKRIQHARRPLVPLSSELVSAVLRIDIEAWVVSELQQRGLTPGDVLDLRYQVAIDEPLAEQAFAGRGLASEAGRTATRKLFLHGFDAPGISRLLDLRLDAVEVSLRDSRLGPIHQLMLRAHFDGLPPGEIVSALGVSWKLLSHTLARAGVHANREFERIETRVRDRIVTLRLKGASYAKIMRQTGATRTQISNTIQLAKKKGLLPGGCGLS
jgi:hypothetical protein